MKKVFTSFFLLMSSFGFAQQVETFFSSSSMKVVDALIFDSDGNLYGSDFNGSKVYKITPEGVGSDFITGLNTPNGLAFDSQENLWVCDLDGNKVYKIAIDGTPLDTFSVPNPSGILKMLDSDTMYISQYKSNIVSKLAPDGTVVPVFSGTPLNGPVGLCYDGNNNLYVANFTDRKIFRLQDNQAIYLAQLPTGNNGWLGFITYAKETIWATNFRDNKIYKVYQNYSDSISLFAGSSAGNTDGPIASAKFNGPNGITPSLDGNSLYISDYNTGRIRILRDISANMHQHANDFVFEVFPNPVLSHCTINFKQSLQTGTLQLYNLSGKKILEKVLDKNKFTIDLNDLPSGIYTIKVITDNTAVSEKIIKR